MKAMVLCAGYGTRLGDLTREKPKAMLDLAGRPLLERILRHLHHHGFTDVLVNLHFQPETIRRRFGDGSALGLRLAYSFEPTLLGTAGGVGNVRHFFEGESAFLVQYGDILTDQPFGPLLTFHQDRRATVTMLVHQRPHSNSVVRFDAAGRVLQFLERPSASIRQTVDSVWVNSGVYVCSPDVFRCIPPGQPSDFPRDVFPQLIPDGRLHAFPLSGYRCAIDSPERLAEAQAALQEGRCPGG